MRHILFAGHGAEWANSLGLSIPLLEKGDQGGFVCVVGSSSLYPGNCSPGRCNGVQARKSPLAPLFQSFPKRGNGGSSMFSVIDDNLSLLLHPSCSEWTYG